MADDLVTRAPLADHGEFRAYHHASRDEIAFEVLREADGRACLLRLPYKAHATAASLVRQAALRLTDRTEPTFNTEGLAVLRRVLLSPDDRLAAVVLASDDERAFAFWREERLRAGWSWTIDVVVVPRYLAPQLCALILDALDRLGPPQPSLDQSQRNLRQA